VAVSKLKSKYILLSLSERIFQQIVKKCFRRFGRCKEDFISRLLAAADSQHGNMSKDNLLGVQKNLAKLPSQPQLPKHEIQETKFKSVLEVLESYKEALAYACLAMSYNRATSSGLATLTLMLTIKNLASDIQTILGNAEPSHLYRFLQDQSLHRANAR
jgi:hypothetical protein